MKNQESRNNFDFFQEVPRKVLRVALFRSPTSQILGNLTENFEKLYGCNVIVDIYPYELLKQNLISDLSQKLGRYDIFTYDCTWLSEFAEANYLEPLDKYFGNKKLFSDRKYQSRDLVKKIDTTLCWYENERFGLPLISNIHILAYRKDILKKYPSSDPEQAWTWEEFKNAAKFIKKETGMPSATIRAKSPALVVYNWYPYLSSSHNISKKLRLKKALEIIKFFYDKKLAPHTSIIWSHEDPVNWLIGGKLAMDQVFNLEMAYWIHASKSSEKIGFASMPRHEKYPRPTLGGYALGISSLSKNKDLAFQFSVWATSPKIHRRIVEAGGTPCRHSELDDKKLLEKFPYFKILKNNLPHAETRPKIPQWSPIEVLVATEIMQYITGQKNIEQAVAAIEKSGSQIIE